MQWKLNKNLFLSFRGQAAMAVALPLPRFYYADLIYGGRSRKQSDYCNGQHHFGNPQS